MTYTIITPPDHSFISRIEDFQLGVLKKTNRKKDSLNQYWTGLFSRIVLQHIQNQHFLHIALAEDDSILGFSMGFSGGVFTPGHRQYLMVQEICSTLSDEYPLFLQVSVSNECDQKNVFSSLVNSALAQATSQRSYYRNVAMLEESNHHLASFLTKLDYEHVHSFYVESYMRPINVFVREIL